MSRLLLIRHAQSANNAQSPQHRVPDPGLTLVGYQQAKATATALRGYTIRNLYCSPFLRAMETARAISEVLSKPAFVRSDLFEEGGCYSGHLPGMEKGEPGMGRSELCSRYPGWNIDPSIAQSGWWGRPFESTQEAIQRAGVVRNWLENEVATKGDHWDVMITHADFKRLLLLELLGASWGQQHDRQLGSLSNAGLTMVEYTEGTWIMHTYNATTHLTGDLLTR
ncbi:MAG TPA: hypothetical protein DCF63_03070 [Planctomycetaceae bacterium]|nr:hypothetical protein [Planctomycetaceae bacterium]